VFGDVTVSGADEVEANWDEIKRKEETDLTERTGVTAAGMRRCRRAVRPAGAGRAAAVCAVALQ
jgi:hypothetical protein